MKIKKNNDYSDEELKRYMALPVRKKFEILEGMNSFFERFMPAKSKKIWEELQKKGF